MRIALLILLALVCQVPAQIPGWDPSFIGSLASSGGSTPPPLTYYVANAGNDANDGLTLATAFQTVMKASQTVGLNGTNTTVALKVGDTFAETGVVFYASGSVPKPFRLTSTSPGTGYAYIKTTNASAHPSFDKMWNGITFMTSSCVIVDSLHVGGAASNSGHGISFWRADSNAYHLQGPIISNCAVTNFDFGIVVNGAPNSGYSNTVIDHNYITNCGTAGINMNLVNGVLGAGTHVIHKEARVTWNSIGGIWADSDITRGFGILFQGVTNSYVAWNHSHHIGMNASNAGGGPANIIMYVSAGNTIDHNLLYGCYKAAVLGGVGMDSDANSPGNTWQYNYTYGNDSAGFLFFDQNDNTTVRYNIIADSGIGSLNINDTPNNLKFYNNTSIEGRFPPPRGFYMLPTATAFGTNFIVNNYEIIQSYNTLSEVVSFGATSNILFKNNLYFDRGRGSNQTRFLWGGSGYTRLDAWRAASGQESGGSGWSSLGPMYRSLPNLSVTNAYDLTNKLIMAFAIPLNTNSAGYLGAANMVTGYGWSNQGTNDFFGDPVTASSCNIGAVNSVVGTNSPDMYPGLYFWYDSDNMFTNTLVPTTRWDDLSGHGFTMLSTKGAPIGAGTRAGHRMLSFTNAASGYFTNTAITNPVDQTYSIVWVANYHSNFNDADSAHFTFDGVAATNRLIVINKGSSTTSNYFNLTLGAANANVGGIQNTSMVYEIQSTPAALLFYTNGVVWTNIALATTNIQGLAIGSRFNQAVGFFDTLDLFHVSGWTNDIASFRSSLVAMLRNRYGL